MELDVHFHIKCSFWNKTFEFWQNNPSLGFLDLSSNPIFMTLLCEELQDKSIKHSRVFSPFTHQPGTPYHITRLLNETIYVEDGESLIGSPSLPP